MNHQLTELVKSVISGAIQDPGRVRKILREAEKAVESRLNQAYEHYELCREAQRAFVGGWSDEATRD